MNETLKEQIKSYITRQICEGATSITISEIQRNFSIGYLQARDILNTISVLTFNPCCGRYSVNGGAQ